MASLEPLIDTYCAAWSAASRGERERLARESLADAATYTDPGSGPLRVPELLEHIARMHASRPGVTVARTSRVDAHHGLARFGWKASMPDGSTLVEGVDVVELDPNSARLQRVVGFFGALRARGDDA